MPLLQGGIVMWAGAVIDIPDGWQLCDGTNGSPDLQEKFIIGAGDVYSVESTGGSPDSILVSHTHTISGGTNSISVSHTHTVTISNPGTDQELASPGSGFYEANATSSSGGNHGHSLTVAESGTSDGINANLPPYYVLAYIQQIA
jgi:hypothetical protein